VSECSNEGLIQCAFEIVINLLYVMCFIMYVLIFGMRLALLNHFAVFCMAYSFLRDAYVSPYRSAVSFLHVRFMKQTYMLWASQILRNSNQFLYLHMITNSVMCNAD
jgi:hypothetical protein